MNIWNTIVNGSTYGGSAVHCLVNYGLIALTILPNIIAYKAGVRQPWIKVLISAAIIQVLIWFLANAVGVSLIWCIMTGSNGMTYIYRRSSKAVGRQMAFIISFIAAGVAIAGYAIYFPYITTLAHIIAVGVGIVLYYPLTRRVT